MYVLYPIFCAIPLLKYESGRTGGYSMFVLKRLIISITLTLVLLFPSLGFSQAQTVSDYMVYQGVLADQNGVPLSGTVNVTCLLYTSPSPRD